MNVFRILCLLALTVPTLAQAQTEVFKTDTGHVEFKSSVPLHSFTGTSDHLVGKISLADSTVDFYVDLNTLKTGIDKRDNDMLETLEADKYPFAEFFGKLATDFKPESDKVQEVAVEGEFTVHGVSRQVRIEGRIQRTSRGLKVMASWTINMKDYDIKPPGILFYRVSEKIPVTINATLPPK